MCMYSFFFGMFTQASMKYFDGAMISTFHAGTLDLSLESGVAQTDATDSCIANTLWKKRKHIKEKAGTGERSQTE